MPRCCSRSKTTATRGDHGFINQSCVAQQLTRPRVLPLHGASDPALSSARNRALPRRPNDGHRIEEAMAAMRSWRHAELASFILLTLCLAPAPNAVADSDMDANVQNLVATHLAPAVTSGGLAVA